MTAPPGTRAGGLPLRGGIGETEARLSFSSQHGASTQRQSAEMSYRKGEVASSREGSAGVRVSFVPRWEICDFAANCMSLSKPKAQRAFRHPPSDANCAEE